MDLGWLERRQQGLRRGQMVWPIGFGLALIVWPMVPTASLGILALTILLGVFLLGAWWAIRNVLRHVQPRSILVIKVPQVQIYDSLVEATGAGWQFFGVCGTLGSQPIPSYASLEGAWFAYSGLDWERARLDDGDRVFGSLRYTQLAQTPNDPGQPSVLPPAMA